MSDLLKGNSFCTSYHLKLFPICRAYRQGRYNTIIIEDNPDLKKFSTFFRTPFWFRTKKTIQFVLSHQIYLIAIPLLFPLGVSINKDWAPYFPNILAIKEHI